MKTVYVAMRAMPWDKLTVALPGSKNPDGTQPGITAKGDVEHAGFLPVYWLKGAAEKENPGSIIQEALVPDDWAVPAASATQQAENRPNFEKLDKAGVVAFAFKAETALGDETVQSLRKQILKGRAPSTRHGTERLLAYIKSCHAKAKP